MNRDGRSKIMMCTRQFMLDVSERCNSYISNLEEVEQEESTKLENLPDSLLNSTISNQLNETIESLSSAKEAVEEIIAFLEQLPDILNIKIRKPRQKTEYRAIQCSHPNVLNNSIEKRSERLQFVTTPTLASALKRQSSAQRISTNELVNRILMQNLRFRDDRQ